MSDFLQMSLDDIIKSKRADYKRHVTHKTGRGKKSSNHFGTRAAAYQKSRPAFRPTHNKVARPNIGHDIVFNYRSYHGRKTYNDVWRREYGTSEPCKLVVANLDAGVTEFDLKQLFEEFGLLAKLTLNFDRSGRSQGTADVVFVRRKDALKAMVQYDGVPLDGLRMQIQLATSEIALPMQRNHVGGVGLFDYNERGAYHSNRDRKLVGRSSYGTNKSFAPNRKGGRGGYVRGAGQVRERCPKLATEDLDADLDEYIQFHLPKKIKMAHPVAEVISQVKPTPAI